MKKFIIIITTVLLFSIVSTCTGHAQTQQGVGGEEIQTLTPQSKKSIERFEIEVFSDKPNKDGIFEVTSQKKVNVSSEIFIDSETISSTTKSIEDYYNLNGEYINSTVSIVEFRNNLNTGQAETSTKTKKYNVPKTKLTNIPKALKQNSENYELTNEEQSTLEKHINSLVHEGKFETKLVKSRGITKEELNELKELKTNALKSKTLMDNSIGGNYNSTLTNNGVSTYAIFQAGAYDNYYNYYPTSGEFKIQALGINSKHRYLYRTGTTLNNNVNANSFTTFKTNIDNYEKYIIEHMEASKFSVVFSWATAIASLVTFVAGMGTGPTGWVAAMYKVIDAVVLLATFTSVGYATVYRANLSLNAQKYLKNAQNVISYGSWSNTGLGSVTGF